MLTVESGFRIIMSDPNVKAILINIFGGIVRCDRVAAGVIGCSQLARLGASHEQPGP
mgnify:CR=1 FL=1